MRTLSPPKELCSLQAFSRLGGEIYINKLLSASLVTLILRVTVMILQLSCPLLPYRSCRLLSKTSQNGGKLKREMVCCVFSYCHKLASFWPLSSREKPAYGNRERRSDGDGRKGGLSCCCP